MLTRIITAVVAVALLIPVLVFSDTLVFPIAMAGLALVAVCEMLKCTGNKKLPVLVISAIFGASAPIAARLCSDLSLFVTVAAAIGFGYMLFLFALAVFSHGKYDITSACTDLALVLYVIATFTSIVLLRDTAYGASLYLLAFIGPWVSDSAAYFCGFAFGKHKLIPDVSPKKTVEGSVGGILFTAAAFVVYGTIVLKPTTAASYIILAVIGFAVSVISQIGDLIASLVKRKYGIKDYGKLFPGHGGVMDRFDSVLATAPILLIASVLAAQFNLFG